MDALEAVPEAEQDRQTELSARKVIGEKIARREATAAEIRKELAYHQSRARYLERELKRLQRPVS
jgi:hypothetical protein